MLRADIGLSRQRKQVGIYRGLVLGYPAKPAAFAGKKRLDKMSARGGCYRKFHRLVESVNIGLYRQVGGGRLTS